MSKEIFYKNVLLVGSIMTAGHTIEYFTRHTENLVVFYLLTTLRDQKDYIEIYKNGKLIQKKTLFSPRIPILYYFFVYVGYIYALRYFVRKDRIFVITYHPLFFLFKTVLKLWRNIAIVFWVIDYLPNPTFPLSLYQKLIFYFHKTNKYSLYLGDRVNKVMNGRIVSSTNKKTVMWGTKRDYKKRNNPKQSVLVLIGVIRPSHGLNIVLEMLSVRKDISIKVLGECSKELYKSYMKKARQLGIAKQISFKNKFYTDDQIAVELKNCLAGVALYNTDQNDPIYYTDPGKVKTYTEKGLPVIMTETSEIAPFIKKFNAGKIIRRDSSSLYNAIKTMRTNYARYLLGVEKFNRHFAFETYYKKHFAFMEEHE